MNESYETSSREVTVTVPEACNLTFKALCDSKQITPGHAASIMVYFACRLLEESPLSKDADLLSELDFARGLRSQTERRADQLLGLAEKTLVDAQGIHRALRNRIFIQSKT